MKWVTRTAALTFLLCAQLGAAQIYKWIDDNGNVRFSDKPPPGQGDASAQKMDLPGTARARKKSTPIAATGNTRLAALETIRYRIQDSELDREIGKEISPNNYMREGFEKAGSSGSACSAKTRPMDVSVAENALRQGMKTYQQAFHRLLQDHGYSATETKSAVFAAQASEAAEISIGALVKKAYFERCTSSGFSFNKTELTIEWQVFDNLERKVLFTAESSGSDDQFGSPPVRRGHIHSFENAFIMAAEALLADEGFLAAVSGGSAADVPAAQTLTSVSFEYGNDSRSFVETSHLLEQGTVTIRTPAGHGSGFFISNNGHILTNDHVVAGTERVLIITSAGQEYARVLRTEPARDVALLQTDAARAQQPLRISQREPRIGEQIYVVGTPLAEELSFSVTRGIVSGKRTMLGQPLIQTDAAVSPGNSGGPVVDEFGNVIAISVSGIFSEAGGSLNTNFLIPIDDALAKIGVTPAG